MALNIFDVTRSRVQISGMPANDGTDILFSNVSRSLSQAADSQMAEWQSATVNQAAQEGELEGSSGEPQYRTGNNLSAQAYNDAAKKSFVTNLETKAAATMGQFAEKFKNDPVAYQTATQDYIKGLTGELKSKSQTAGVAELFSNRLALDAQTQQYSIQKRQAAIQKEQMQADNENLYMTLKNNAYREAGGVFSKDPEVQRNTLKGFSLSKQALDTSLHAVLPDGTPVYSPMEVQKREEDFFRQFYTQAARNYITEGDPSPEELSDMLSGKTVIKVPGLGEINLLDNIGADRYDRDVAGFAINKLKEREAMVQKSVALQERAFEESREYRGISMMTGMLTGKAIPTDQILDDYRTGKIKGADAKALIKLATDPNTGTDDPEYVASLKVRAALGEDVTAEAKRNSYRMTGKTFNSLMEDSVKGQNGIINDNRSSLVRQVLRKDEFGFDDPSSVKKAHDVASAYDQLVKDGTNPSLAYEKAQDIVDSMKGEASGFTRVPKYTVVGMTGVDIAASFIKTEDAFKAGRISPEEFLAEGDKLTQIQLDKEKKNAR